MSTISSPGLASGIDVKSIVSQLVALERAPLAPLQTQANSMQSKLSVYGNIKSMVASLGDAAAKLSTASGWNTVTATSSNAAAVGATAAAGAASTSLSIEVQQLAKAQSTASAAIPLASSMGSGLLSIQLGGWSGNTFTPGSGAAVEVTVQATDTLTQIAAKINEAGAGVSATVLRDASGERLLMRSNDTGEEKAFRVQVTDDDGLPNDAAGLSRLAYDPGTATGATRTQQALNALATVNNVAITSASNKLSDTLPGLTLQLSQVTTAPVEIGVSNDTAAMKKNVEAFVTAYNTLNTMLTNAIKYNPETKVAGSLQGDSTAIGLQNALRGMMRSVTASSPFSRLADVGIQAKEGGNLEIKADTLDAALNNLDGLKALFTTAGDAGSQGFGLKIKSFADGLLSVDGLVSTRTESLQSAVKRNTKEQDKVIDRAARAEVRLLAQYNAMDAAVGRLNGLSAFVNQQVTLWNKNSG
ncbi:flagellar filament capping protein FliD [Hydrogenophaga sp.]|uniref:flagellar filament capping protein FliD n=1 Tax=Hydrogenophaga sp. TaxID=1904254 RepID=UPI00273212D9|nr:flagellar filament capping protein FliD [Hydrogenophaga sp.]MDP2016435.1 flagellar filament capping protein FliD [Hydrogenophaga sp.]MDP3166192.1 flagellar filament capping protein FliD [Hydrogenophaga sp.]MDP3812309.1 flagellar filament capping protein FliD [Hydrogenophaga sp.]